MENYREDDPTANQGNGEGIQQEGPLPLSCMGGGVVQYGVQRYPIQNYSLSSFMTWSPMHASRDTATASATINPPESVYSEVVQLRTENARLRIENSQLAWSPHKIQEKDEQIGALSQRNLKLEQENAKLKLANFELNQECTRTLKEFVEERKREEITQNIPLCARSIQIANYVEKQERNDHMVSKEQMKEKGVCFENVVKIVQDRTKDNPIVTQAIQEILQGSQQPSKKQAHEDEEDRTNVKKPRKSAHPAATATLTVQTEDTDDETYESPPVSPAYTPEDSDEN